MQRQTCLASFVVLTLMIGGCAGSGAGSGASGEWGADRNRGTVEASAEEVIASTKAVFAEMKIEPSSEKVDEPRKKWEIKGKDESGRDVEVDIRQIAPEVSEVSVRVGMLGDRNSSATIYDRIASRL